MFTPNNDPMRRSVWGGITDNYPPTGPLRFEAICEQGLVWCTDEAGDWWATRRPWEKTGAPDNAQLANLHYARAEPPAEWAGVGAARRPCASAPSCALNQVRAAAVYSECESAPGYDAEGTLHAELGGVAEPAEDLQCSV